MVYCADARYRPDAPLRKSCLIKAVIPVLNKQVAIAKFAQFITTYRRRICWHNLLRNLLIQWKSIVIFLQKTKTGVLLKALLWALLWHYHKTIFWKYHSPIIIKCSFEVKVIVVALYNLSQHTKYQLFFLFYILSTWTI